MLKTFFTSSLQNPTFSRQTVFIFKYLTYCNKMIQTQSTSVPFVLKELDPIPNYIQPRIDLWEKFRSRYLNEVERKKPETIQIVTKDKNGKVKNIEGLKWKTTPLEVAKKVGSKFWCDSLVIAKVDGQLWDLDRILEGDCQIEFLKFEDHEGKNKISFKLKAG